LKLQQAQLSVLLIKKKKKRKKKKKTSSAECFEALHGMLIDWGVEKMACLVVLVWLSSLYWAYTCFHAVLYMG
jgi:hypothetical protein